MLVPSSAKLDLLPTVFIIRCLRPKPQSEFLRRHEHGCRRWRYKRDVWYADDSERALDQSFWRRFPSRSRFFEDVWKATRGSDILLANLLNARQDDASRPAAIHWYLRGERKAVWVGTAQRWYTLNYSNFRSLGRPASLRDRKEVSLASRTTAAAIKLSSLLNRKRHVVNVAFDPR